MFLFYFGGAEVWDNFDPRLTLLDANDNTFHRNVSRWGVYVYIEHIRCRYDVVLIYIYCCISILIGMGPPNVIGQDGNK